MDESRFELLTEEALDALERGDYVRALAITDQLVAVAGDDPVVRAIRARTLVAADAGEEALVEARRAAELDPENKNVQLLLGLAAWRMGKLTLAQQSLEQAVQLSGEKPGPLTDYAWFMASERGPRIAEDVALEAVAANENSSTAWAALGLAQLRLHRHSDAEASLRRALELDPNDPYAQSAMATLLQEQRDDPRAVALAHLLEDTPGTEEFVEDVRRRAKRRQVEKMLVERGAGPRVPGLDIRYWHWIWLLCAVVSIIALCWIFQPEQPLVIFFCAFVPLFLYWCLRMAFD